LPYVSTPACSEFSFLYGMLGTNTSLTLRSGRQPTQPAHQAFSIPAPALAPAPHSRRIPHLRRRPIPTPRPRRRRANPISHRRRRIIIPIAIHRPIVALPRRPRVVAARMAVMPTATSTAAVVVVVVMAGVRRVVVRTCGSRVGLSRVSGVPARFGDYYYPGVDYARDPAEDCEDDVEQKGA
jgi:hypothetical protein